MLAIALGDVVLTILWSWLIMQYDRLGWDHVSIIWNREVSLIRRSSKYTRFYCRPFWTVDGHLSRGVLNSEGHIREVPLYER